MLREANANSGTKRKLAISLRRAAKKHRDRRGLELDIDQLGTLRG